MEVLVTELVTELAKTVISTAVPSLVTLLKSEWGLDKTVNVGLKTLQGELNSMQAFLEDVSSMPPEKLSRQVTLMARVVRKLFSAIEIHLHSFIVDIESTKGALLSSMKKQYVNHKLDKYIKETLVEVKGVRERHGPYPSRSSLETTTTVNPHFVAMYMSESNPEGIDGPTIEVTSMLSKGDYISIVGMMGLGKTTLARAVYDHMKEGFECRGLVLVGQRANMKQVLKKILDELGIQIYDDAPQEQQLIEHLRSSILDKRCLLVLDDIWDNGIWNVVDLVFKNSVGSKIITTTRNRKVAEQVGGVYQMKPLAPQFSKKLLRIKAEADTDDTEFEKVSDRILRKCGGVPMAINTIGRFLAKNKSQGWYRVYDSIGFDEHKRDGAFEHIKQVLSCSYFDLPYQIQKCFLYLSLFPEDHWIEKNMLIWRWLAEGLVSEGNEHNLELFELGETYLNELADRGMVQWAVSPRDLGQGGCRVHSLMFELMHDLSNDQNFSTVLGMKQESISQRSTIHRLAIHKTSVDEIENTSSLPHKNPNTSLEVGEVWSFYATLCPGSSFPPLSRFERLRVIDLEGCNLSAGDSKLEHLGKLAQLGYIGLLGTKLTKLPKKIGGLKVLQTLDVTGTGITELPLFVGELCNLRCLRAGKGTTMMGHVGKLALLEELWLHSVDKSPDFAVELRKLTKMRVLVIHFDKIDYSKGQEALMESVHELNNLQEALVKSLRELKKIQVLQVWFDAEWKVRLPVWEGSVPFPKLRQLLLFGVILPCPMPWIHESCVPELTKLLLEVQVLKAEDLAILGKMTSLRALYLHSEDNSLSYTAGKDEFKVLEYLNTNIEMVCGNGALPFIQELEVGGIRVGRDVGLQGNMPVLEKATYHIDCMGCGPVEIQKAEEALKQASEAHPNRPALSIKRFNNFGFELKNQMFGFFIPEVKRILAMNSDKGSIPGDISGGSEGKSDARCTLSSMLGNPVIANLISDTVARCVQPMGLPPTLAVGGATDASSQFNEANIQVSTANKLGYLNSQNLLSSMANQLGMDPTVLTNMVENVMRNPQLMASLGSIGPLNTDGSLSPRAVELIMPEMSKQLQLMMPEMSRQLKLIMPGMSRQFDQNVDGPGISANNPGGPLPIGLIMHVFSTMLAQASTEGWSGENFDFDASAAMLGITATETADIKENIVKLEQNPEFIALCKSLEQDGAQLNVSNVSELAKLLMPYVIKTSTEKTDGLGRAQGAETDLAGKQPAEISGVGVSSEPPPKVDINSRLSWLSSTAGLAAGAAQLGMSPVAYARIYEKYIRCPEIVASLNNAERTGDISSTERHLYQLMIPDLFAYFFEQYMDGPLSTIACTGGGGKDDTSGMPPGLPSDPAFGSQMAAHQSGVMDAVARNSGSVAPDVGVDIFAPQESVQVDGELVSRMLKEVLPVVQQALAAGASSGSSKVSHHV